MGRYVTWVVLSAGFVIRGYLSDVLPLRLLHNVVHPCSACVHIVDHSVGAQHLLHHILHSEIRVKASLRIQHAYACGLQSCCMVIVLIPLSEPASHPSVCCMAIGQAAVCQLLTTSNAHMYTFSSTCTGALGLVFAVMQAQHVAAGGPCTVLIAEKQIVEAAKRMCRGTRSTLGPTL